MDAYRAESQAESGRTLAEREQTRTSPENEDSSENSALADALAACRSALERQLAGLREDGPRRDELESLRAPLAHFAALAAEQKLPPERVIVMLKRMVRELPSIGPWRQTERDGISHELVAMMIAAYYSVDGDGR